MAEQLAETEIRATETDGDAPPIRPLADIPDAGLVARAVREDDDAFAELFRRHAAPAWRLALAVAGTTAGAVSAVAEGFTRVLARARDSGAQPISFRLAVVSATRLAALAELDDGDRTPAGPPSDNAVVRAYRALPERWRSVLWLAMAEGGPRAQVAPLLGLSQEGTDALLERALVGLRQVYVDGCRPGVDGTCRQFLDRFADHDADPDDSHLASCAECRRRAELLSDARRHLRSLVIPLPLVLGDAALAHWHAWQQNHAATRGRALPMWAERAMGAAAASVIGVALVGAVVLGARTSTTAPELAAPISQPPARGELDESPATQGTRPSAGPGFPPAGVHVPTGSSSLPSYRGLGVGGRSAAGRNARSVRDGSTGSKQPATTPAPSPTPSPAPAPAPPQGGVVAGTDVGGTPVGGAATPDCTGLQVGQIVGGCPPPPPGDEPIVVTPPPPPPPPAPAPPPPQPPLP
jgi:DNA-directed RNA polymerase specialized sigma24 family protein